MPQTKKAHSRKACLVAIGHAYAIHPESKTVAAALAELKQTGTVNDQTITLLRRYQPQSAMGWYHASLDDDCGNVWTGPVFAKSKADAEEQAKAEWRNAFPGQPVLINQGGYYVFAQLESIYLNSRRFNDLYRPKS